MTFIIVYANYASTITLVAFFHTPFKQFICHGAMNISYGALTYKADNELPPEWREPELQDRSRPIITACETGELAALAGKLLKDMGFANVSILEGGTQAWKEAGFPTMLPGEDILHIETTIPEEKLPNTRIMFIGSFLVLICRHREKFPNIAILFGSCILIPFMGYLSHQLSTLMHHQTHKKNLSI